MQMSTILILSKQTLSIGFEPKGGLMTEMAY